MISSYSVVKGHAIEAHHYPAYRTPVDTVDPFAPLIGGCGRSCHFIDPTGTGSLSKKVSMMEQHCNVSLRVAVVVAMGRANDR